MNGKSQPEAVDILRNTRGLVKLLVQRKEVVQSPRSPAIEVSRYIQMGKTKTKQEHPSQIKRLNVLIAFCLNSSPPFFS